MSKPGVKTVLNDEMILKLRQGVLEGKNAVEMSKTLGISEKTIYAWRTHNYQGIQDKWNSWELQRKLKLAEEFSERLMTLPVDENGRVNTKLASIQQREAEFLRSSLLIARDKYDKRESGTKGTAVQVNIIKYNDTEALQIKDDSNVAQYRLYDTGEAVEVTDPDPHE